MKKIRRLSLFLVCNYLLDRVKDFYIYRESPSGGLTISFVDLITTGCLKSRHYLCIDVTGYTVSVHR